MRDPTLTPAKLYEERLKDDLRAHRERLAEADKRLASQKARLGSARRLYEERLRDL